MYNHFTSFHIENIITGPSATRQHITYSSDLTKRTTYMIKKSLQANKRIKMLFAAITICIPSLFFSCTEEIDDSNFTIKSEMTAADFIDADPNYSMIKELFLRVRLGASDGASSLYSVLSARGNYTIFLPTNEAIKKYMAEEGVDALENLTEEQATLIAKSCIIDNSDDNAYETADFPSTGSFSLPNLNDRMLSCTLGEDTYYIINGTSKVIKEDNEVSNGFIHIVDAVVAPSSMTIDKLIASSSNMKVFSYLVTKTTWCDSLRDNLDLSYEDPDRPITYNLNNVNPFTYAQHRYLGYTALVEPDSIYEEQFGLKVETDEAGNLTNGEAFLQKVQALAQSAYGTAAVDDLTHPDNAVNRFVAYHFLLGKMAYNKLVHHCNEYNYKYGDLKNPQTTNMPTNVWDYYTTVGKHRDIVKITQVGDAGFEQDTEHKIYANRISEYANGTEDDYRETGVAPGFEGVLLSATNGENDNNGLNGYYYPINKILIYSDGFRTQLSNERMRMDATTILHEMLSNNVRGTIYYRFENGYFDNITRESSDTKLLYLFTQSAASWRDYQGDELMVAGLYDFTMKLPRVPKDGTYEIRMGTSHNSLRGMCQIYFGSDPDRLTPAGLPYDMRQPAGADSPTIPWIEDGDDWTVNRENDKNLRNQGYMKGPQYFTVVNGNADTPCRQAGGAQACLRRIITVADMKADQDYYLRFKTALKKTDSQFFFDYLEYASTNVYNGPTPEDIW